MSNDVARHLHINFKIILYILNLHQGRPFKRQILTLYRGKVIGARHEQARLALWLLLGNWKVFEADEQRNWKDYINIIYNIKTKNKVITGSNPQKWVKARRTTMDPAICDAMTIYSRRYTDVHVQLVSRVLLSTAIMLPSYWRHTVSQWLSVHINFNFCSCGTRVLYIIDIWIFFTLLLYKTYLINLIKILFKILYIYRQTSNFKRWF